MYVSSGEVHTRPAVHLSVPQPAAEWRDPTVNRVIYSSDGALWADERFGEVESFGFNLGDILLIHISLDKGMGK